MNLKFIFVTISVLILQSEILIAGCINYIAESEIPKAIALKPNAGNKVCGKKDPCICFDGINWKKAKYLKAQKKLVNIAKVQGKIKAKPKLKK